MLPGGIDDPAAPSGGNRYDRRVCDGLAALGWTVREHPVPGTWPQPDRAARARLAARARPACPTARWCCWTAWSPAPSPRCWCPRRAGCGWWCWCTCRSATRRERAVLRSAAAVVTTSDWTRRRVLEQHRLDPATVHVAEPGVDAAALAPGTAAGTELLCVGAVSAVKGHDVLVDALALLGGPAGALHLRRQPDPGPGLRRARCATGSATGAWPSGCAWPGRAPAPTWTPATPPPTSWCWPRAASPTAWSSPRRWPAGCR